MTLADRRLPYLVALVVVAATARTPRAQPATATDDLDAEALFRAGKRLMQQHDYAAACAKFAASDRIDESTGTLLNLGDCLEKTGALATAWATFTQAVSVALARGDAREAEARRRAKALEPRLSYLTIAVARESRLDGLRVLRDGAPLDPALWNQRVPVDPGTYEIAGEAPGHVAWHTSLVIRGDGQQVAVAVPRLAPEAPAPSALAAQPAGRGGADRDAASTDAPVAVHRAAPARRSLTPLREASIAAAVVGVAGLGGGAGFALDAGHLEREANAICPGTTCADPHGLDLNRRARGAAGTSTALFVAGGVALAGAAVMWLAGAPPHADAEVAVAPVIAPAPDGPRVGFAVSGRF